MTTQKLYLCPHTGETNTVPCCEDCNRVDQLLEPDFTRQLESAARREDGDKYWPHRVQPPDPRWKEAKQLLVNIEAEKVYVAGKGWV